MDKVAMYGIPIAVVVGAVVGWVLRGLGVPKAPASPDARRSEMDTVDEDEGTESAPEKNAQSE